MTFVNRIFIAFLSALFISVSVEAAEKALPFPKGEKIVYTIKKMGVKGGEATLIFSGENEVDGKPVYLIEFVADGPGFLDKERIFVDRTTFLPVRVDRDVDIRIWGKKKEKIIEYYDQVNGQVKILKTVNGKTTEQVIDKGGPMDNLYGFIYRYRQRGKFTIGDKIQMNLPTMNVKFKITKKDKVKAGGRVQEAYFMESDPAKYKVWFDGGGPKVPVRIDGAVGFGSTSMVLRDYSVNKSK